MYLLEVLEEMGLCSRGSETSELCARCDEDGFRFHRRLLRRGRDPHSRDGPRSRKDPAGPEAVENGRRTSDVGGGVLQQELTRAQFARAVPLSARSRLSRNCSHRMVATPARLAAIRP